MDVNNAEINDQEHRTSASRLKYGGVAVVAAIALLAVGAASFMVWWHYQQGRRALEFWGQDAAQRIRHATQVEVLRLDAGGEAVRNGAEILQIDGRKRAVVDRRDISRVAGLVHARHALIEDASFQWETDGGDCEPQWDYAVRFTDVTGRSTIAIDFDCRRVQLWEDGREATLIEQICDGWRKYTAGSFAHAPAESPR